MTIHVAGQPAGARDDGSLLPQTVKIGMPHLDLNGLSENWLLKECGHRHWFLLAAAAGMPFPDFRDAAGDQVYAVFRAVTTRNMRPDAVRENDDLHFNSTLSRISRTQFASRHELICRGEAVGEVEMLSSFVKRTVAGVNKSVARVTIDAFPFAGEVMPSALADTVAEFQNNSWREHRGFSRDDCSDALECVMRPNPAQDFNGAGFLYFASFPTLADRAEWEVLSPPPTLVTVSREIIYYGNIEPGESIVVRINNTHSGDDGLSHWCTLYRHADKTKIADIFTAKQDKT